MAQAGRKIPAADYEHLSVVAAGYVKKQERFQQQLGSWEMSSKISEPVVIIQKQTFNKIHKLIF